MTKRLTPEEKIAKKAADEARQVEAQLEQQRAIAAYKASLPKRIKEAQLLAASVGVATHVELTDTGPSVRFEYEDHSERTYIDLVITYQTLEYEIEYLEGDLKLLKDKQDAREAQRKVAQGVWDKLTPEERIAVKEHIHWMRS